MWVKAATYITLVDARARAEVKADWLMAHVNRLERDVADLKLALTGQPQRVATYLKEKVEKPETEIDFEDMGDQQALFLGLSFDDEGRVQP